MLATAGTLESERSTRRGAAEGVVDVSELPTVVDAGRAAHRFAPGPMTTETDVSSWVTDTFAGPITQIDLHNACGLNLGYAFAPGDEPSDAEQPRRVLDRHTIQTQLIPEGHWLHLWNGDRWLGAAVTTVSGGLMEISPDCDTLEVSFELPDRGPTRFAIHWELDADEGDRPRSSSAGRSALELELALEQRDAPEPWGLDQIAGPGDRVELRLANLCAEPVDYVFTSTIDDAPAGTSTIPGHTERSVEVPAGWWLRYQALDEVWRGGATTSLGGAVVWLSSNCVDFGVGDGRVIALGG